MLIPWQEIDAETLNSLIEHFVLREGTDYGAEEISLADKVAHVQQRLQQGEAVIAINFFNQPYLVDKFEVGAEVREAFCANDPAAAEHFQPLGEGKYLADLPALARQRLRKAGVQKIYGNDSSKSWCTVSNPSRFFSYRRDQRSLGGSGRFAVAAWLDA